MPFKVLDLGRGGAVKLWKEKADSLTELMNYLFNDKALPGFAKDI